MSERNLETVRRLYAILRSEAIADPQMMLSSLELFDPEVEVRQMAVLVGTAGTFHGYEGLAKGIAEVVADFDDIAFGLERFAVHEDAVATEFTFRAIGRASGVPVEFRGSHEFRLRDGRILRWVVDEDPDAAFRAIGAEPPAGP